ncbi:hypothetical protein ACU686_35305 [Yinghuangia aomiensis]
MTTLTTPNHPHLPTPRRTRPALLLTAVLTGQFIALLDVSVVNVAGPPSARPPRHRIRTPARRLRLHHRLRALIVTGARLGHPRHPTPLPHRTRRLYPRLPRLRPRPRHRHPHHRPRHPEHRSSVMVPQVLVFIQRTFDGTARARALGLYAAVIAGGTVTRRKSSAASSAPACTGGGLVLAPRLPRPTSPSDSPSSPSPPDSSPTTPPHPPPPEPAYEASTSPDSSSSPPPCSSPSSPSSSATNTDGPSGDGSP